MKEERWERLEELFHAALQCPPEDRPSFLDEQCGTDQAMRRVLESLLASHDTGENFVDIPPSDFAREFLAAANPGPAPGERFDHYRIQTVLGSGGLAEVLLAVDERLNRLVAIKFLRSAFNDAPRLEHEAKAASALNHPNILTVYDVGTYGDRPYLVTEYVEGETLRQRVRSRRLTQQEAIDIARGIASALAAAHRARIVHRDIKPENVMLRPDGVVKVLDFGLAKILDRETLAVVEARTRRPGDINTGLVVGTPGYMSPEQIGQSRVDARSDVFSTGLVLREMLSDADTLPEALERIIAKATRPDPNERYAHAGELLADLEKFDASSRSAGRLAAVVRRRSIVVSTIALLALVAVIGGLGYWMTERGDEKGVLATLDTILLADFDNQTGDSVFDEVLKQALAADLGQSPFLNILADAPIAQTLRTMGRPENSRLLGSVAREVCARNSSKASIEGSIAALGSQYVVGLTVTDCSSRNVITREQQRAQGKEEVLKALDRAASNIRPRLGESLASIQKYDVPLEQLSTPSLEAFESLARGYKVWAQRGEVEGQPLIRHAVDLDPNFAMAIAALATLSSNLRDTTHAREYAARAFTIRGRASEREQFYIDTTYHMQVDGDIPKAIEIFKVWTQTYPRDWIAHNNLCSQLSRLGALEDALKQCQEALRLAPWVSLYYSNVGETLMRLNRLEESKRVLAEGMQRFEYSALHRNSYLHAFLTGDQHGMERELDLAKGRSDEPVLLEAHAASQAARGRLREAAGLEQRAIVIARGAGNMNLASSIGAQGAVTESFLGQYAAARRQTEAALKLAPDRDALGWAALALAEAGDTAEAEKIVTGLSNDHPSDTLVSTMFVPIVRAQIYLQQHAPQQALDTLQSAPYNTAEFGMYASLLRGRAYLMLNRPADALAELQGLLDQRGNLMNYPVRIVAEVERARAYAMAGDTARAREAFGQFLTSWRDADDDVPLVRQVRAEYAQVMP